MCYVCHQSTCSPTCPNAEEPKSVGECEYCGFSIRLTEDDEFIEVDGKMYHLDCLSDMAGNEIAELFDLEINDPTNYVYSEADYYEDLYNEQRFF